MIWQDRRCTQSSPTNIRQRGLTNSGKLLICEIVWYKNKRLEKITNHCDWELTSDKRWIIFEINYYDGQWHYNQPVSKSQHARQQTKGGYSHEFFDQCRVKNSRWIRRTSWSRSKIIPSIFWVWRKWLKIPINIWFRRWK